MTRQIGKWLFSTHPGVLRDSYRFFRIGRHIYKPVFVIWKLVIAVEVDTTY